MSLNFHQLLHTKRLFLVGGKGGVGKTTIAATLAVTAADFDRKVMLISTDPAHNLSDVFNQKIGGKLKKLNTKLSVIEIDPDKEVDAYLDRVMRQMRRYIGADQVTELTRQLNLSRQSPGAQEAAILERISELMVEGLKEYDLLIFDTAPTGHTLRLLTLPELMAAWTEGLLRHNKRAKKLSEVMKHLTPGRSIESPMSDPLDHSMEGLDDRGRQIGETLLKRQRLFHRVRHLLSDESLTGFLFALTPERLPILETKRAVASLQFAKIPIEGLIINRVLPRATGSSFWTARHEHQKKHLQEINDSFRELPQIMVPLLENDIEGIEALKNFSNHLITGSIP